MSGEIGDSLSLALQHYIINRRKFRSQTSDNMDRWKAELGRGREKRKIRRKKSRRERVRRKKMEMREKVGKSRNTVFFPMIRGSGGSKSRLAKAAGAEPAGQMRDEKLHAVVARSRFPSQNVQNTPAPDHFWKLRCQKSARRCGAKHISESKCTKHTSVGPLLEVQMSKKCTPLWREAHFQVKMYKTVKFREWGCLAENKCFWKTSILTCVLRELVVLNFWADLSEHLGAHKYHVEFA